MTVDTVEITGAREDLFLTTPRRDEIHDLKVQILQAQQPWRSLDPCCRPWPPRAGPAS